MTARTDAIMAQEFSALADWQVRQTLNLQTVPAYGDAKLIDAENYLLLTVQWGQLEYAAKRGTDQGKAERAFNAMRLFTDVKLTAIGYGDHPSIYPAIEAQMTQLVTDGTINEAAKTYILSLATVQVPKWDPLFTDEEVGNVRKAANFYG